MIFFASNRGVGRAGKVAIQKRMGKADVAVFGVVAALAQVGVAANGMIEIFVVVFANVVNGAEGGGEVGINLVTALF